jgi:hypothetical protein
MTLAIQFLRQLEYPHAEQVSALVDNYGLTVKQAEEALAE